MARSSRAASARVVGVPMPLELGSLLPSLVLVVDPALAEAQLERRVIAHDHDEEHPGQRGGVAEAEVLEGLIEEVDDVEQPACSIAGR